MAKANVSNSTPRVQLSDGSSVQGVQAPGAGKATKLDGYVVGKKVVLPLKKLTDEVPAFLLFQGAIYTGKELKGVKKAKDGETKSDKPEMAPAELANVVDLETGEECQIIVNAVLRGVLDEFYPDAGYVGKAFQIVRHAKAAGKRYNTFSVDEIIRRENASKGDVLV